MSRPAVGAAARGGWPRALPAASVCDAGGGKGGEKWQRGSGVAAGNGGRGGVGGWLRHIMAIPPTRPGGRRHGRARSVGTPAERAAGKEREGGREGARPMRAALEVIKQFNFFFNIPPP